MLWISFLVLVGFSEIQCSINYRITNMRLSIDSRALSRKNFMQGNQLRPTYSSLFLWHGGLFFVYFFRIMFYLCVFVFNYSVSHIIIHLEYG